MPIILQTVVIVFSWRSSDFRTSIKGKSDEQQYYLVRTFFACVMLDPLVTFALGCLYLNPWRLAEVQKDTKDLTYRPRQDTILRHFFSSIVDFPFLVMYFILAITVYRFKRTREKVTAVSYFSSFIVIVLILRQAATIKDKRFFVTEMFCCLIFDVPMVLGLGFIKLTRWHVQPYETELDVSHWIGLSEY